MKSHHFLILAVLAFSACKQHKSARQQKDEQSPIVGTWQLVSDKIITKGDTAVAYPGKGAPTEMIKMYNETHFAFFNHDLSHGKQKTPLYDSGAGTFKLTGNDYSEHLEYCNEREWENHDFKFKLTVHSDTLVQKGIERIDSLNINREIIETYVRKSN
ncbi:hypothetical protein [Mucilaginibacter sp. KACC 22063]|uniref:hypothetical protein n=1 Tax=Mucilaginibacter sp. KACC 22063 TaxID=3025666 RepID=UPI0023657335|nr:hypothetical protein [Mucilaginibacter sp. KACC 22063]WDF56008.1 hypothetical protein PQ461_02905 [Mucilaginibacter sp. KACC 22063]